MPPRACANRTCDFWLATSTLPKRLARRPENLSKNDIVICRMDALVRPSIADGRERLSYDFVLGQVLTWRRYAPSRPNAANTSPWHGLTRAGALAEERSMWSGLKWACGLVLLTLLVYWDGRDFDYVWDDALYVQQNADVQAGLTAGSVRRAFAFRISNWQPLVWLSLMADVEVFGFRPRSFHTTNLCLHAANAVLLFCWLRKLTGREFDSAFVAAVFAVHPLHVESVEWISGRKDVLSMFFGLLTLLAWERYLRVRSRGQLACVCLAYLASLMSKQLFVTLPVLLLMLDFWPL